MRRWLLAVLLFAGCSFGPPTSPLGRVGQACPSDPACASGRCEGGICVECRTSADCASPNVCQAGVCGAGGGAVDRVDGVVQRGPGGRVHVGRVATVPVTTEVVR